MKILFLTVQNNIYGALDVFYSATTHIGLCPYKRTKNKYNRYVYEVSPLTWRNGIPIIC